MNVGIRYGPKSVNPIGRVCQTTTNHTLKVSVRRKGVEPGRMNDFHVIAHGEEFDVDAFLATTTLRPSFVWRGDLRSACFESRHETSGIELSLGDGLSIPLCEQEKIAIAYLQEHRVELVALGEFP